METFNTDDNFLYESYDAHQIQKRIEESDAWLDTAKGVAHGSILASIQQITAQTLYGAGAIGLFPAVATALPVAIALGVSLNTITIDNGLSISDIGKFSAGVFRCTILAASTVKVHLDYSNADKIANEGVQVIEASRNIYEGKPQPKQNGDFWLVLALVVAVAILMGRLRSKK